MAEQNAEQQFEGHTPAKSSRRKTLLMGGGLLGVMAIEAVIVFALVRSFGPSPATVQAAPAPGLDPKAGTKEPIQIEMEVVRLRAQNERSQRQVIYDMEVFVCVTEDNKAKIEETLQRRRNTILDRLSQVVRAADPERFTEPDLRTLRKQFQTELAELVGDEQIILQVLIPSILSHVE